MQEQTELHEIIFMVFFTRPLNPTLRRDGDGGLQASGVVGSQPAEETFLTLTEYANAHCADP